MGPNNMPGEPSEQEVANMLQQLVGSLEVPQAVNGQQIMNIVDHPDAETGGAK